MNYVDFKRACIVSPEFRNCESIVNRLFARIIHSVFKVIRVREPSKEKKGFAFPGTVSTMSPASSWYNEFQKRSALNFKSNLREKAGSYHPSGQVPSTLANNNIHDGSLRRLRRPSKASLSCGALSFEGRAKGRRSVSLGGRPSVRNRDVVTYVGSADT